MENSRGAGVWKRIVLTLHCPYCIEGDDFRPMVELGGSLTQVFFCSSCHHLAYSAEVALKCECANCRNLNRKSERTG